jgi:type II secretory pathway pseudopilin PulG
MVVTIIGIVAAIAVPRLSNATTRASANVLQATLTNVRKAIDCYYAEHDKYPGYDPNSGAADGDQFVNQLLMYSNAKGETNATYGYPYIFGPYLRAPFPANPTNRLRTVHVKATPADASPPKGSVGWVAVLSHGFFGISATDSALDRVGIEEIDGKSRARGFAD